MVQASLSSSSPMQNRKLDGGGRTYWLPEARTFHNFLYAYSALFGIPSFVEEALVRQPDRFSIKRLPLTIRSTASFVLDAFGFDRRTGRERNVLYSPGPAIRHVHARSEGKARITDPAMAYFVAQLYLAAARGETEESGHFDYVKSFLHAGGYPFPQNRTDLQDFVSDVDRELAGNRQQKLWGHLQPTATALDVDFDCEDLIEFLPSQTAGHFTRFSSQKGDSS